MKFSYLIKIFENDQPKLTYEANYDDANHGYENSWRCKTPEDLIANWNILGSRPNSNLKYEYSLIENKEAVKEKKAEVIPNNVYITYGKNFNNELIFGEFSFSETVAEIRFKEQYPNVDKYITVCYKVFNDAKLIKFIFE